VPGDTEKSLYNLDFKEVKKLDPGGPITVKASRTARSRSACCSRAAA
jgi:hypothetical protein